MRGILVAVAASVVLAGAACGSLAHTSTPDGTVHGTSGSPIPLMDESFARTWPNDQGGSAWFADGGYRLSARQPRDFVAVRAPLADVPRDVIVSGTFRKLGGPPGGGYGLIVADQGSGAGDGIDQSGQFIVAEVGDRGDVGIWRRNGRLWTDLVAWTPSKAVHADTVANDLTVQLIGGRLTFLVNGAQVAEVASVDAVGMRPGGVGIFTGGDLNDVVVNRFQVQAPARPADLGSTPDQPPAPQPTSQSRASAEAPGQRPPSVAPGGQSASFDPRHVRDLLAGIAGDMRAILESFAGGPNDPHDPVNDASALKQDAARLAAATSKANELQSELGKLPTGVSGGR